jgi:hypothetical protein
MLRAIKAALAAEVPREYFRAIADTDEEATANFNLYRNRMEWERRQAASAQADSGWGDGGE